MKRIKEIRDAAEEVVNDTLNELTLDIMQRKSFSLGEARVIAYQFFLMGVFPKTDDFEREVEKLKTLWEV